jgi:hypothetical protein
VSVTEQDRKRARKAISCDCADRAADDASPNAGVDWHFAWCAGYYCDVDDIAAAIADERERARAPFLAYADECTARGDDPKTGILKRAVNRAVAAAFRHVAKESE